MPKTPSFYFYRRFNTECSGCGRLKRKGRRGLCKMCKEEFLKRKEGGHLKLKNF